MDHWINLLPVLIISAACIYLMLSDDWKKTILCIGAIFLSSFIILIQFWTFVFSLVKLITGLMSLVVLGISIIKVNPVYPGMNRGEKGFRSIALILTFIIVLLFSEKISEGLSIPLEIVISSLFILICGIVQLGMTQIAYKVFLSILLIFFGFEMIYSTNETSLLVNGMLASISLIVSFIGAYIVTNESERIEESEEE